MVHKAIIEHQYQQFNSFENIHFSQILFILKAKNLKTWYQFSLFANRMQISLILCLENVKFPIIKSTKFQSAKTQTWKISKYIWSSIELDSKST